jgi:hypothetical protein
MKPVVESSRNLSELLLEPFSVRPFFAWGTMNRHETAVPVMSAIRPLPVPPVRADFRIWHVSDMARCPS